MRKSGEEVCYICGKSPEDFINSRMYFKHFKTKSHAKESYDCDQCEKKFLKNEALKSHKGRMHLDNSFQCAECGKNFHMKEYLKKHMETHNKCWGISCKL